MENNKKNNDDKKNNELEELRKKCEDYLNGWKRERADFLNYKKDEMERISQIIKYANEEIILKILPILDNIYLAETQLPEELKNHKWIEGFGQIKKQISDFLEKEGVEAVETVGKPFDPKTMESVGEIENNEKEAGTVAQEVQRGYMLHGKLIRPAKVKITKQFEK